MKLIHVPRTLDARHKSSSKANRHAASRGVVRAFAVLMTAMLAAAAALMLGVAPASATDYPGVTSVTIISPNSDPLEPLHRGQVFGVAAEWQVPDGAVGGDTFSLSFPSPVHAYAATIYLVNGTSTVGSCAVTQTSFVCTLNSSVDTLDNVHGTLQFGAIAAESSAPGTVEFVTGTGLTFAVTPPGGEIVGNSTMPNRPEKWGTISNDGTTVYWTIAIPGSYLAAHPGIVFTDIYDSRLSMSTTFAPLYVGWVSPSDWNDGRYNVTEVMVLGSGTGTYSFTDSQATSSFDFGFNTPLAHNDGLYTFSYQTPIAPGVSPGTTLNNTLTASSAQVVVGSVTTVTSSGTGTGATTGAFMITKSVTGTGAASVPASTEYTVNYSYTAAGATVAKTLTVVPGTPKVITGIPTDTVVTLSEAAPAAISGITYGTAVFGGAGVTPTADGATITIGNANVVGVTLQNPAVLTPVVVPPTGSFTITKDVTGTGAASVPTDTEYTVNYSYTAAGASVTGSLTLVQGTAKGLTGIPTGTVVTLAEATPTAISGITYGTAVFGGAGVTATADGTTITIGDATTIAVTLENPAVLTVELPTLAIPAVLAHTGADTAAAIGLGIGATSLLLAGMAMMLLQHRRRTADAITKESAK